MSGTRELKVVILGDADGAKKAFGEIGSHGEGLGSKLQGVTKVVGATLVGLGAGVAAFGVKAVMAGSDLSETLSKVNVVFGSASKDVEGFANKMAGDFGLPKREILDAAASIGLVGKASGLAEKDAAKMSTELSKLAADASSFYNVPLEEALQAIQSGLVGEAEPMRRFGVLLNEDAVKAEALRLGLVKTSVDTEKLGLAQSKVTIAQKALAEATAKYGEDSVQAEKARLSLQTAEGAVAKAMEGTNVELTEAQKAQARASLITKGMTDASGDLERTQGSLANRIRELQGRASNFAADVGMKLLPIVLAAWDAFDRLSTIVGDRLGKVFEQIRPTLDTVTGAVKAFLYTLKTGMTEDEGTPIERIALFIRDKVLPVLEKVAGFVSDNLMPILAGLAGIAGGVLLVALGGLFSMIAGAISPFVLIAGAIAAVVAGLVIAYQKIEPFRAAVNGVVSILTGVVLPAVWAVAQVLVDVLGAAIGWLVDHWGEISATAVDVFNTIAGVVGPVVDQVVAKIGDLVRWAQEMWPLFVEAASAAWERTKHGIEMALNVIVPLVEAALTLIRAIWSAVGDDLFNIVERVWHAIWGVVDAVLGIVRGLIQTVLAVIAGDWGEAWDGIRQIIGGVWDAIYAIVAGALGIISSVLGAALGLLGKAWDATWWAISAAVGLVWDAITGAISKAIDLLVFWFTNFTPVGLLIKHWDTIKDATAKAWEWISDKVSGGIGAIVGFVTSLPGKIKNAAVGAFDGLVDAFRNGLNTLIRLWNDLHFTVGGNKVDAGPLGSYTLPTFTLDTPNIPYLAAGGILKARPGGRVFVGAEAGEDEAVIPLSKLSSMIGAGRGVTVEAGAIVVQVVVDGDVDDRRAEQLGRTVGRAAGDELEELLPALVAGVGAV